MRIKRIFSEQVLYLGPGVDSVDMSQAYQEAGQPVVSTRDILMKLFPEYIDLDVPKKSQAFRPLIDRAVDLSIAAYILMNLEPNVLVISERLSSTFHNALAQGNNSLFLTCDNTKTVRSRWPDSRLGVAAIERWTARTVNLGKRYGRKVCFIAEGESTTLSHIKVVKRPDAGKLPFLKNNPGGWTMWDHRGLNDLKATESVIKAT